MKNVNKTFLGLIEFNDAMGTLVCLFNVSSIAAGAVQNTVTLTITLLFLKRWVNYYINKNKPKILFGILIV